MDSALIVPLVVVAAFAFAVGFALGRGSAGKVVVREVPSVAARAEALPDDAAFVAEVALLIAADQKIEAIKRVRERTGWGLKEAKDAVEAWPPMA